MALRMNLMDGAPEEAPKMPWRRCLHCDGRTALIWGGGDDGYGGIDGDGNACGDGGDADDGGKAVDAEGMMVNYER